MNYQTLLAIWDGLTELLDVYAISSSEFAQITETRRLVEVQIREEGYWTEFCRDRERGCITRCHQEAGQLKIEHHPELSVTHPNPIFQKFDLGNDANRERV